MSEGEGDLQDQEFNRATQLERGPKSVIILGSAKSGTTALYYAVRNALAEAAGKPIEGLHEPTDPLVIRNYLAETQDAIPLAKVLLGPLTRQGGDVTSWFDKRVVIYRDPRDNVISRIVFMLQRLIPVKDHARIEQVKELFRRKETAPESLSVLQMIGEIEALSGRKDLAKAMRNNALLPAEMKREREQKDGLFLMSYDDMVQGRYEALSDYLGLPIKSGVEVDQKHSYVVRTKGSGEWRNWFLAEDIQFFAKDVAADFALLGFDANETANETKVINASTCSEYVASQFQRQQEKRRETRARKQRPEGKAMPAARSAALLEQAGADGLFGKVAAATGMPTSDVAKILAAAFGEIKASTAAGAEVSIPGVGVFQAKTRGKASERNSKAGKARALLFRPARPVREGGKAGKGAGRDRARGARRKAAREA